MIPIPGLNSQYGNAEFPQIFKDRFFVGDQNIWTAARSVQHMDSFTTEPCSCNRCRMWLIVLLKPARPSLEQTPSGRNPYTPFSINGATQPVQVPECPSAPFKVEPKKSESKLENRNSSSHIFNRIPEQLQSCSLHIPLRTDSQTSLDNMEQLRSAFDPEETEERSSSTLISTTPTAAYRVSYCAVFRPDLCVCVYLKCFLYSSTLNTHTLLPQAASPPLRDPAAQLPRDCSGVVPDCHGVTQNGSGSSSVTSPALVLVETPNESVCGGTVVSTKMNVKYKGGVSNKVASEWKPRMGVSNKVASEWKPKGGVSNKAASEWKHKGGVSNKVASEWKPKVGVSNKVASEWKPKVGVSNKVASEWKPKGGVSNKVASEWKHKGGVSNKVASEWKHKGGVSNKVATEWKPKGGVSNKVAREWKPKGGVSNKVARQWKPKGCVSNKVASEWKHKVGVSNKVASEWKPKGDVSNKLASEWKPKGGVSNKVASEWKPKGGVSNKVASEWKPKGGVSNKVASEWKPKGGVSNKVATEWKPKAGVSNKVATTITDIQRAVVSSMSRPVSAAPSADGCTTQDYMHTDRYHDCP
ncbi:hypothetical protein NFI96_007484 [Prochilodus magdalenae]|nr:hypothetical protein NFI96_007484 [Prochilodus magdalenae]